MSLTDRETLDAFVVHHEGEVAVMRQREAALLGTVKELADMIAPAYCLAGRFETCGDPFCSEAREKRDDILARGDLSGDPT